MQTNFFMYQHQRYVRHHKVPSFKNNGQFGSYSLIDTPIIVHSEANSSEVEAFDDAGYQTVHWFSHGVIARDWFRYAEYDATIANKVTTHKKFLIYNRAWSGTREYRLKFASMLAETGLVPHCKTSMAFDDNQTHYNQHCFANTLWRPSVRLENYFKKNCTDSTASADYSSEDYQLKLFETVLETIFDEDKISLTEKSLRPLATGTPFILAAPANSLAYLRGYGFETFSPWINESYDKEPSAPLRLQMIVNEMQRLSALDESQYQYTLQRCLEIARRNKSRFFSSEFQHMLLTEYQVGMNRAITLALQNINDKDWLQVAALHTEHEQRQIAEYLQQR